MFSSAGPEIAENYKPASMQEKKDNIRILIAEDHEFFRNGLKLLLNDQPNIEVIGEASNGLELVSLKMECQPDLIITDIVMPEMDGIEATTLLINTDPKVRILALTLNEDEIYTTKMLEAGALGYVFKLSSMDILVQGILAINKYEVYYGTAESELPADIQHNYYTDPVFTEMELQVLDHLKKYTLSKAADRMQLDIAALEWYLFRIRQKLRLTAQEPLDSFIATWQRKSTDY